MRQKSQCLCGFKGERWLYTLT